MITKEQQALAVDSDEVRYTQKRPVRLVYKDAERIVEAYCGEHLRAIRAFKGVGRPPKVVA
jgi:hypothetical protein